MVIINTPHNPTGAIFSMQDMQKLEKNVNGTDYRSYFQMRCMNIYYLMDRTPKAVGVARFPKLADRSFIISFIRKKNHITPTGWKIGYCLAPKELMTGKFRKAHNTTVFLC